MRLIRWARPVLRPVLRLAGSAKYPLDLLRDAGVDMERPEPVETALAHFGRLVDELDELL
jgi:oligoendopeptidase F